MKLILDDRISTCASRNGGTKIWTIYLLVDPTTYALISENRESLQDEIKTRLEPILGQFTDDWYGVTIAPKVEPIPEWRHAAGYVSSATRQNIVDGMKIDRVHWAGSLEDVEFLQRLYDLESMPSLDRRFQNAAADIWQHRFNNPGDWPDDWIYDDTRFNLMNGPTDTFLRFLCEVVHPVVRPERNEALGLVQHFNDQLRRDGWNLVEQEKIAGRPRFVAARVQFADARLLSRARTR